MVYNIKIWIQSFLTIDKELLKMKYISFYLFHAIIASTDLMGKRIFTVIPKTLSLRGAKTHQINVRRHEKNREMQTINSVYHLLLPVFHDRKEYPYFSRMHNFATSLL